MRAVLVLIFLTITLCHEVPEVDLQLVDGFIDGYGLINKLVVVDCKSDFNDFLTNSLNALDSYIEKDYKQLAAYMWNATAFYWKITSKCDKFKPAVEQLMSYSYGIYQYPNDFLVDILDNMVSLTIIEQYYGLKSKLKNEKFYDAGVSLGIIMNTLVSNVKINEKLNKQ
jgi:hypothetical protein